MASIRNYTFFLEKESSPNPDEDMRCGTSLPKVILDWYAANAMLSVAQRIQVHSNF